MSDVLEERLRIALAAERARDDVRAARARAAALVPFPAPRTTPAASPASPSPTRASR